MKTRVFWLFGFLLILWTSCDRPACKNTNTIFDSYSPATEEYKNELANLLNMAGKMSYWVDSYLETDSVEYLVIFIQGEKLCAKGYLEVNEPKGIEGIKRTRGQSYHGAELIGLKYDIFQTGGSTRFIYKSVGYILD